MTRGSGFLALLARGVSCAWLSFEGELEPVAIASPLPLVLGRRCGVREVTVFGARVDLGTILVILPCRGV